MRFPVGVRGRVPRQFSTRHPLKSTFAMLAGSSSAAQRRAREECQNLMKTQMVAPGRRELGRGPDLTPGLEFDTCVFVCACVRLLHESS